jgi:hypothetical protein
LFCSKLYTKLVQREVRWIWRPNTTGTMTFARESTDVCWPMMRDYVLVLWHLRTVEACPGVVLISPSSLPQHFVTSLTAPGANLGILVTPLHVSAPECHLQGVCEHKGSQVQHSPSGINWICDSLCPQIPWRWQSGAETRRGDAYHKLCVIVFVLLYFYVHLLVNILNKRKRAVR